jgi:hypothetical protein
MTPPPPPYPTDAYACRNCDKNRPPVYISHHPNSSGSSHFRLVLSATVQPEARSPRAAHGLTRGLDHVYFRPRSRDWYT